MITTKQLILGKIVYGIYGQKNGIILNVRAKKQILPARYSIKVEKRMGGISINLGEFEGTKAQIDYYLENIQNTKIGVIKNEATEFMNKVLAKLNETK